MSTKSAILKTFFSLAVAGVLAGGLSVSAKADDDRLDEAWKDGIGDQEPVLTDQQFAKLNNLAFQAAVTKICDGYNLDDKKFADGMAEATTPADASLSADDQKQWETAVLIRFGTTYGLLLAEGNAKPKDFCASADELKKDTETPNIWQ
jgi:hypothetical protein